MGIQRKEITSSQRAQERFCWATEPDNLKEEFSQQKHKGHSRLKEENQPKAVETRKQETSIGREYPDFT